MPKIRLAASVDVLALADGGAALAKTAEPPPVSEQLKNPKAADVTIASSTLEPAQLAPSPERLARPSLPKNFEVFAENLANPRTVTAGKRSCHSFPRKRGFSERLRGMADRELVLTGQPVKLECTAEDGHERVVRGPRLFGCDRPNGCVAAYYPEVNPLVLVHYRDELSHTPAFKGVPVRIRPGNSVAQAGAAE